MGMNAISLTTDGAGDASGLVQFGFNTEYRRLYRVACDYSASAAATTDLTITDADGIAVFTVTDVNTDFDKYISDVVVGKSNAAITNGQSAPLVRSPLTVTFAQGGATKTNAVKLWTSSLVASRYTLDLVTSAGGVASQTINFGFNSQYRKLVRVAIDYASDFDAGGDVTITDGDGIAVFTVTDTATDFDKYLMDAVVTKANGAVTNGHTPIWVKGPLTVAIAQGGATKKATVKLWLEK